MNAERLAYTLRLGDAALIFGQRMIERVTLMPELEEELANANFALDYIGQARMFYQYAAELVGGDSDEDFFAFRRDAQEFTNPLMLELPLEDFGDLIVRQFLFESFYLRQLQDIAECRDARLSEIATRAIREIRYHLRHTRQWLLRLGDGTDESHARVQAALDRHWRYSGEFFTDDAIDERIATDLDLPLPSTYRDAWMSDVSLAVKEATLLIPEAKWLSLGGKHGHHSEHLGFLVAEMQHLQRSHPTASW